MRGKFLILSDSLAKYCDNNKNNNDNNDSNNNNNNNNTKIIVGDAPRTKQELR